MSNVDRVAKIRTLVDEMATLMLRMGEITLNLHNLDCEAWFQYQELPDGKFGDMSFHHIIRNEGDLNAKKVDLTGYEPPEVKDGDLEAILKGVRH